MDAVDDHLNFSCPLHAKSDSLQELARINQPTDGAPFFLVDLSVILQRISTWEEHLPRVRPLYAMKANPNAVICKMLMDHGVGLECASKSELEMCVNWGVDPQNVLFGAPVKPHSHLQYAKTHRISKCVADSVSELHNISRVYPEVNVYMRIAVDDQDARCRFSSKFGLFREEWPLFFQTAVKLGVNLCGVSFHVGSGGSGPLAFFDAIHLAREAFIESSEYGFHFRAVDIGGGFPGDSDNVFTFSEIATAVNLALEEAFPPSEGVEVYAEPGRFYVSESHTYAVCVTGKKNMLSHHLAHATAIESTGLETTVSYDLDKDPRVALYLNDGIYGCFNCTVFDHATLQVAGFISSADERKTVPTKLFGPTCDSIDVVHRCLEIPKLEVGDWILWKNMGAYTTAAASRFNGFGDFKTFYILRTAEQTEPYQLCT